MKKILIALDYDPGAQKIAEEGYALARAMNADTVLIHVVADSVYYSSLEYSPVMGYTGFSSPDMVPLLDVTEFRNAADEFLQQTKSFLEDNSITTIVGEGDCAESILETAGKINADIIVMGSHSRRGLDKILMGSISEKVLRHTNIPLFLIPSKKEDKDVVKEG